MILFPHIISIQPRKIVKEGRENKSSFQNYACLIILHFYNILLTDFEKSISKCVIVCPSIIGHFCNHIFFQVRERKGKQVGFCRWLVFSYLCVRLDLFQIRMCDCLHKCPALEN